MNVIYYYYYLFYSKILKDSEPHLLTTLVLSFSQSLLVNGVLEISIANIFCIYISKWPMLIVLLLLIGVNYVYYHRTGKAKEIVKNKPMFFSSHRLSIIITLLFFIITASFLFWEPIYVKQILDGNYR